jgi:hypothetical protein
MNWDSIVEKVSPYIVKIETPSGSGTGFLCFYNEDRSFCGIATALHVVAEADKWQQPIRIHNYNFKKTKLLKEAERIIFTDDDTDSAMITLNPAELEFPESLIQLRPKDAVISIGNEVGWIGYPGIYEWTLCFFSGCISANRKNSYLIDGVAINGVSGGPVLYSSGADGVQIVGTVSAYRANRQFGDALPGLLIAQDVSHFHSVIQVFRNLDEARKKKAEEEAKKKQTAGDSPSPAEPATATPDAAVQTVQSKCK